jgi:hypothetical protein
MKKICAPLWCLVLCGLLSVHAAVAQENKPKESNGDETSKLVGDWSGESICVNKEKFPACKDEVVVYHITKVADKTDTVNISADKIVNGKSEFMGAFDFIYDSKKQTLTSEFKNERVHLLLEFVVKKNVLEGGITSLPDKTQVRRIKVQKNK